jgi:hypothetical protein
MISDPSDLGDLILFDNTVLHRSAMAMSGEGIPIQVRIEEIASPAEFGRVLGDARLV